jgi:Phenazine biosynthesis-like protein
VPLIVSLYESFAAARFGGNVAGVVLLGEPLPEAIMQGIAGDLAAPTTGFVTSKARGPRGFATSRHGERSAPAGMSTWQSPPAWSRRDCGRCWERAFDR